MNFEFFYFFLKKQLSVLCKFFWYVPISILRKKGSTRGQAKWYAYHMLNISANLNLNRLINVTLIKNMYSKEKIYVTKIKSPWLFPDFPFSLSTLPDFTRFSPTWEYHPFSRFSRFSLIAMNPEILPSLRVVNIIRQGCHYFSILFFLYFCWKRYYLPAFLSR